MRRRLYEQLGYSVAVIQNASGVLVTSYDGFTSRREAKEHARAIREVRKQNDEDVRVVIRSCVHGEPAASH